MIKRQKIGRRPTRFGIVLDELPPRHQKFLLENYFLKELSKDDRTLNILFLLEDKRIQNVNKNKLFIDPKTKEVFDKKTIQKRLNQIDWNCTYCKKDIKSSMNNFDTENFVCDSCIKREIGDSKWIPEAVIRNSYDFTLHCKKLLKIEQKKFIKYITGK